MKNNLKSIVAIIVTATVLGTTLGMPSVIAKSAISPDNNPTGYETIEDLISKIEGEISELEGLGEVTEEAILAEYAKQELLQLKLDVEELNISQGATNSLLVKLDAVLRKINQALEFIQDGNKKQANNALRAASNVLGAFINELEAQSGKKIAKEDAVNLIQRTQTIIEIIKEKSTEKAIEKLELVEKPGILVEIDQSIEKMQKGIAELQAMGLAVEFVEEEGTYMIVIAGSPITWTIVVPLGVKAMLTVAGALYFIEYKLGEVLTWGCKAGLYTAIFLFDGTMTALSAQKKLVALGLGILDAAAVDAFIGHLFEDILIKMAEYIPACILPLPWVTCSTCPEPPERRLP